MKEIFSLTGPIGKTNFRGATILLLASPIFFYFAVPSVVAGYRSRGRFYDLNDPRTMELSYDIWIILAIVIGIVLIHLMIKRMRDIGKPFWYAFIPFYNLYVAWEGESEG